MILPREHETPFNKAPLIRAVTALLMVISILSAITRLVTRMATAGNLKLDDILVGASTKIMAIAQSIAVIIQGANGLGKMQGLSADQVSSILKAQYTSDVLFILTLLLAKISATRTIWGMAPRKRRGLIWATEGMIGAWALSSIAASFFQCSIPEPWDYVEGQCFNRYAFWVYVDALNIITDLAITSILVDMFIHLKTSVAKKTLVIGVFGCRTFIIPPIICHMYYYKAATESNNPIFDMWPPTIITQVILCLSVMATCIPYLKPFLDSLESGQMIAGDLRGASSKGSNSRSRSGPSGYASASAHTTRPRDKSARGIMSVADMASNASYRRQNYEMMDMGKSRDRGNQATVTAASEANGSWDRHSQTSQTVLVEQSWTVDVHRERSGTTGA
ncbi:uncharacterized protein NECHADRAFT_82920 [Fusarium vanettenii 77-13-4]|uniref:Rhodopsin domain-containing protein n=1 Tax=Fusarium vanettenii (strain ATCC MYA-4622 / CBS 123669 / FGSC 9596 / NRRL 45880 / 77-13-4) TaxID=660122 RepID=C7YX77_FUSV7|nr:uncharacterized protein NECHADRAFT_89559 [Fusarium vanettenii 77-13-4]XP_003049249.1 uncharacterized protein NECHADRAFT_82920 [Fusarium vanettenii 77-13-4]EEU33353.1 hypothetical protein NECHADRAFT_89559 [Fusarium vanettenii 77-13-4]EEU43536.1 hypothetical protein NECHADRAFT_82920 [Fusarium vanettenii 77-13-4]